MEDIAEKIKLVESEELIGGQYRVTRQLGAGANGSVYEAHHIFLDRKVALKTLRPEHRWDKSTLMRFTQEARALARLDHPGLIDVHEFGVDADGTPYLVMDYEEDFVSLDVMLKQQGRLPSADVVAIAIQCADALQHAHARGIFHRDIKPSNILLGRRDGAWHVKVIDFGIVKVQTEQTITQTGSVVGTPDYMSPEALEGHAADARSDVYSLGVTMFEMLMGCRPYAASTPIDLMNKQTTEPLPEMDAAAWPELKSVIARCLAVQRERRFQSMSALATALRYAEQHPTAGAGHHLWLKIREGAFFDLNKLGATRVNVFVTLFMIIVAGAMQFVGLSASMDLVKRSDATNPAVNSEVARNQIWYQAMLDAESFADRGEKAKATRMYEHALRVARSTEPIHRYERIEDAAKQLEAIYQSNGDEADVKRIRKILEQNAREMQPPAR